MLRSCDSLKLPHDLNMRQRFPIGPKISHRVVGVGYRNNPGKDRDRFTGQPVRITMSVVPLMMMSDTLRDLRPVFQRGSQNNPFTSGGVGLHDQPVLVIELCGLLQDRVRNTDLSDVVETGDEAKDLKFAP